MWLVNKVRNNFTQFVKFAFVGGSGLVVNMIVAVIMTGLHGGVSNDNDVVIDLPGRFDVRFTIIVWVVAFMLANVWNYQLNRMWTFANIKHRGWWREFWPFFLVGLVAAGIGIFIKWGLTNPTSIFYLPDPPFNDADVLRARAYWAQLLTIVITMPINYIVNKVWTFRGVKPGSNESVSAASVAFNGVDQEGVGVVDSTGPTASPESVNRAEAGQSDAAGLGSTSATAIKPASSAGEDSKIRED